MLAPPGYQKQLSSLNATLLSRSCIIVTSDWIIVFVNMTSGAFLNDDAVLDAELDFNYAFRVSLTAHGVDKT